MTSNQHWGHELIELLSKPVDWSDRQVALDLAERLVEQYEDVRRLQASDSERAYELGNEAERLQRENTGLLEQMELDRGDQEVLRQGFVQRGQRIRALEEQLEATQRELERRTMKTREARVTELEEQNGSLLRDNETLGVLNETLKEQLEAALVALECIGDGDVSEHPSTAERLQATQQYARARLRELRGSNPASEPELA